MRDARDKGFRLLRAYCEDAFCTPWDAPWETLGEASDDYRCAFGPGGLGTLDGPLRSMTVAECLSGRAAERSAEAVHYGEEAY